MTARRVALAGLVLALAAAPLVGCGGADRRPMTLTWRAASLPVPDGDRALVRDATWCDDRWVVIGATADERDRTRPAAWVSAAGVRWRAVRLHPGADYYSARAVLGSVGCARGRLAVLGAKSGGAHGNPRTATWRERPDGTLAAVPAPFELYGGVRAIAVNRLEGGRGGYLIAGTRSNGAAVWTSARGERFVLHEGEPGLAGTRRLSTQALDAVWWHGTWTVAGMASDRTGRLSATAWTGSGAGPWTPHRLPGGSTITTAERLTTTGAGPVAVGLDDDGFGVWVDRAGGWSLASTFGADAAGSTSAAYVSGLAWTGSLLAATYSDGTRFRLAVGAPGGLDVLPLPTTVTVRGDHTVTLATHLDHALLLTDDGSRGRVWTTRIPGPTS